LLGPNIAKTNATRKKFDDQDKNKVMKNKWIVIWVIMNNEIDYVFSHMFQFSSFCFNFFFIL